jgi:hypothetical protein
MLRITFPVDISLVMTQDSKLVIAEKRLADAKAEVARWELFIATYRELDGSLPLAVARKSSEAPHHPRTNGAHFRKPERISKLTHTEQVAGSIIAEYGRAVPSAEMLKALIERGVDIGGKEPASTLAARLSRATTIEFQRGLGWALRPKADAEGA